MFRWCTLLLLSVTTVFGQNFQEGLHSFDEAPNWSVAQRGSSPTRHGVAMFSGVDVAVVEPDGSLIPLPVPAEGMRGFQTLHQDGDNLVGVWNAKKGREIGVLDFDQPQKGWKTTALPQNSYSYVTCLGADPEGRLYASIYGSGVINFQKEPGAQRMEVLICPEVENGRMQALTSAISTEGTVWFVTLDSFQHDSFSPMGKALLFKDGAMQEIDIGEKPRTMEVVPLEDDCMFISFSDRPGILLNGSTGEAAALAGFDPKAFGNTAVFQAGRAPDGTLWMLSAPFPDSEEAKAERKTGRFHQLWRWDGTTLESVHDGVDTVRTNARSYYGHIHPDIAAVSRDEVHIGTDGAGLFSWRKEGGASWFDWRHGVPSLTISRLFAGGHFILFNTKGSVHTLAGDWHSLPATVNEEIVPFTTWSDIQPDLLGRLHAVKGRDGTRFDRWQDGEWIEGPDFPVAVTNYGGFAFDSENRPWVYSAQMTSDVYVASSEDGWTAYETPLKAFEEEVAAAESGYQPAYPHHARSTNPLNRPLIVNQDEIWFVDRNHRLNILRDGAWKTMMYKDTGNRMSFARAPYLNQRGRPRIVQGSDVMGFNEGKLVMVKQGGGTKTTGGRQQQFDLFGGVQLRGEWAPAARNVAPNIALFKDDPRLKEFGKPSLVERDGFGNHWLVAGKSLIGMRGTNVVDVSLSGSPVSVEPVTRLIPDNEGALLLGYGKKTSWSRWVIVRPETKRYRFTVETHTDANRIGVSLKGLDPDEPVNLRLRLDGGPWKNAAELYPVPEGTRTLQVQCRGNYNLVHISDTVTVKVEVDGDIDALIAQAVKDLGASKYATRRDARVRLKEVGTLAREALLEAARSEDPEVREVAVELLRGMRS